MRDNKRVYSTVTKFLKKLNSLPSIQAPSKAPEAGAPSIKGTQSAFDKQSFSSYKKQAAKSVTSRNLKLASTKKMKSQIITIQESSKPIHKSKSVLGESTPTNGQPYDSDAEEDKLRKFLGLNSEDETELDYRSLVDRREIV